MRLDAIEYGKCFQKAKRIVKEMVGEERFSEVYEHGFVRGLDHYMDKHGLPKDMHEANSRLCVGVAMARFYVDGLDLDEIIRNDGTCFNPKDDYVR